MKVLRRSAYGLLLGAAFVWGMRPAPEARAPNTPARPHVEAVPAPAVRPVAEVVPKTRRSDRPEQPPAAAPPAVEPRHAIRVADSIGPLRDHLKPAQQDAVRAAVERKTAALAALQADALSGSADPADISARAQRIQSDFESDLASALDPDQMNDFYRYKQQGDIGTYAIMMPGDGRRP